MSIIFFPTLQFNRIEKKWKQRDWFSYHSEDNSCDWIWKCRKRDIFLAVSSHELISHFLVVTSDPSGWSWERWLAKYQETLHYSGVLTIQQLRDSQKKKRNSSSNFQTTELCSVLHSITKANNFVFKRQLPETKIRILSCCHVRLCLNEQIKHTLFEQILTDSLYKEPKFEPI